MNVLFSRQFDKDARDLPSKIKIPLLSIIKEAIEATSLKEIRNCKKLSGYDNLYRIRMGVYRLTFLFLVIDNTVFFQRVLPRGDVYKKHNLKK